MINLAQVGSGKKGDFNFTENHTGTVDFRHRNSRFQADTLVTHSIYLGDIQINYISTNREFSKCSSRMLNNALTTQFKPDKTTVPWNFDHNCDTELFVTAQTSEKVYTTSSFAYSRTQNVEDFWRFLMKFQNIFRDIDQIIWSEI